MTYRKIMMTDDEPQLLIYVLTLKSLALSVFSEKSMWKIPEFAKSSPHDRQYSFKLIIYYSSPMVQKSNPMLENSSSKGPMAEDLSVLRTTKQWRNDEGCWRWPVMRTYQGWQFGSSAPTNHPAGKEASKSAHQRAWPMNPHYKLTKVPDS